MGRDLGWSKPDLYGAATIGLLLSGLAAYPVGSAIDRGHGRTIMAGAFVLAGILLIAWSQVESIAVFYILLAGIRRTSPVGLPEVAFAVVSRRFGAANARGGIVALTLWAGFASTVFIPLFQFLLDHFGWRETLLVLGGVNIVLCGGLYAAVIDPAADASPQAVDTRVAADGRRAGCWLGAQIPDILGTRHCADRVLDSLLGIHLPCLPFVARARIRHPDRGIRNARYRPGTSGRPHCNLGIRQRRSDPGYRIAGRSRISARLSRTDGYTASVSGSRADRSDLWRSEWDHDHCSWSRGPGNAYTRCLRQDRHPCARAAEIDCALGAGPGGHPLPDTDRRNGGCQSTDVSNPLLGFCFSGCKGLAWKLL